MDLAGLHEISKMTNVLIAVSKADLLTDDELATLTDNIHKQVEDIELFSTEIFWLSSKHIRKDQPLIEELLLRQYMPQMIDRLNEHFYEENFRCSN